MYKLLIADDEQIVVDGIKESIEWKKYDVEVAGTASSGKAALNLALSLKPDIVISDIKMPGLNGLELVEQLKSGLPDTKIILISAYEHFEYAKEAIKLGVVSYITKPFKKIQVIEEVQKAIRVIEERKREDDLKERLRASLRENFPILKEHFLNSLIMDREKYSEELKSRFKTYGVDIFRGNAGVLVCRPDVKKSEEREQQENRDQLVYLLLNEFLEEYLPESFNKVTFRSYNQETVVIFGAKQISDLSVQAVVKAAEEIRSRIKREAVISVSIGIGRVYFSMENIGVSYRDAVRALNYRLVYGNNTVIYIENVEKSGEQNFDFMASINKKLDDFQNVLVTGKLDEVSTLLGEITGKLQSNPGVTYQYTQQVYVLMLSILLRTIIEMNIPPETITEQPSDLYGILFSKESFNEIDSWYREIIKNACSEISRKMHARNGNTINKAVEFMKKHCLENISQTDVAEHINLNASYFSRCFKEETGFSFVDYMKKLRIDKAKEFLKYSGMKVYEVSEALGYHSVQYFSTLFKNIVGVTPQEYKEAMSGEVKE